jgi:hypothetical protein
MNLIFVGALAIKYVSFVVYSMETTKAPFMTEQFVDHPLGGLGIPFTPLLHHSSRIMMMIQ